MKVLVFIVCILLFLCSCNPAKEVVMPFRNYDVSAERLFPLQQSDEKQSIRIWLSRSTSIDRVIIVSRRIDSSITTTPVTPSFSGWLVEYGDKMRANKKLVSYYRKKSIEPLSGFARFFNKLDALNLSEYKDQQDVELVNHQPLSLCVVEYLNNGLYSRFYFRPAFQGKDTIPGSYSEFELLLQDEFMLGKER